MNISGKLRGDARKAAILAYIDAHENGARRTDIAKAMRLNIDCVQSATEFLRQTGEVCVVGWARSALWYTPRNAEATLANHAELHPGRGKQKPLWARGPEMQVRQVVVPAHAAKPLRKIGVSSVWELAA